VGRLLFHPVRGKDLWNNILTSISLHHALSLLHPHPNEIWMAVKVFPAYVRWALINQGEEDALKGIL